MNSFQVVFRVHAEGDIAHGELEATTEVILDRLHKEAAFVALGPVMSVDFPEAAIEVEFTVHADSAEQVHAQVGRVADIVLSAANDFEYESSTTNRLEPALA